MPREGGASRNRKSEENSRKWRLRDHPLEPLFGRAAGQTRMRMMTPERSLHAALRRKSERFLEPRRIARPDLRIEHARNRLAVERRQHLFGRDPSHVFARFACDAGCVRAEP